MRCRVVIDLSEEMKRRGHRAYKHVDECAVRERAKHLPDDYAPYCFSIASLGCII